MAHSASQKNTKGVASGGVGVKQLSLSHDRVASSDLHGDEQPLSLSPKNSYNNVHNKTIHPPYYDETTATYDQVPPYSLEPEVLTAPLLPRTMAGAVPTLRTTSTAWARLFAIVACLTAAFISLTLIDICNGAASVATVSTLSYGIGLLIGEYFQFRFFHEDDAIELRNPPPTGVRLAKSTYYFVSTLLGIGIALAFSIVTQVTINHACARVLIGSTDCQCPNHGMTREGVFDSLSA